MYLDSLQAPKLHPTEKVGIRNSNLNGTTENCNPIDLSVIIKTNLLKTGNWNNNRFIEENAIDEHSNECIRIAIFRTSTINRQNSSDSGRDPCSYNKAADEKDVDDMESSMMGNFHDENCNIKVEQSSMNSIRREKTSLFDIC